MADNEKKFTFRLPEALHNTLVQHASREETTVSDVVRNIVIEHLRVENIVLKLDEFDIPRRFRELYAQARIANHSIDALARTMLGDKYHAWRTAVNQSIEQEVAKRKSEMEKTR